MQAREDQYHMVKQPYDHANSSVEEEKDRAPAPPSAVEIAQNFPNPLNPMTSIQFSVPSGGHARLKVFGARGDTVDVLVDGDISRQAFLSMPGLSHSPSFPAESSPL